MKYKCPVCDSDLELPKDLIDGEVITCLECGADLAVYRKKGGTYSIEQIEMKGEDWGE